MAVDLKEVYCDLALMHSRLYVKALENDDKLNTHFHSKRILELAYEITSFLEREYTDGQEQGYR